MAARRMVRAPVLSLWCEARWRVEHLVKAHTSDRGLVASRSRKAVAIAAHAPLEHTAALPKRGDAGHAHLYHSSIAVAARVELKADGAKHKRDSDIGMSARRSTAGQLPRAGSHKARTPALPPSMANRATPASSSPWPTTRRPGRPRRRTSACESRVWRLVLP